MKIKLIKTGEENEAALARLEEIFDAEPGTPEGDEAELLTALIEMFEQNAYPINLPDPIEAIKFRMEQQGRDPKGPKKAPVVKNRKQALAIALSQSGQSKRK